MSKNERQFSQLLVYLLREDLGQHEKPEKRKFEARVHSRNKVKPVKWFLKMVQKTFKSSQALLVKSTKVFRELIVETDKSKMQHVQMQKRS